MLPHTDKINELDTLLKNPCTIHFIGVGGSGMYPLVQILLAAGHTITGSDVNEGSILDAERKQGVKVIMGQKAQNIGNADLVVYSAAIQPNNPERQEAEKRGIFCVERSIMLGYVTALYEKSLCIAGTHGKTTVTGMCTQILQMGGFDPAAVIGGKLPLINGYGKSGSNDMIVVEACEYHNTFLELTPYIAVLLNVDDDHLEFFGSMQHLKEAFATFCNRAKSTVIYNGDDANTLDTMKMIDKPSISFGINKNCDIQAINIAEYKPGFWSFDVEIKDKIQGNIQLAAPGKHNIYNALAAYASCTQIGANHAQCATGLAHFTGCGRRFEILGHVNGITIADDYAHHPTELTATLEAAKEMGFNQVWAVFQPYTFSRTEMLLDDFADSLKIADHVVMTAIMGGREKAEDYTITTADLAAKVPNSIWFETQPEVAAYVLENAQKGDLVITLGCGDIYKCAHMMVDFED